MKLATWNVNSIKAREERVLAWLAKEQPDVLCLQELKVADEQFPYDAVEAAGYHAAVYGQKTYNGVAILTPREITDSHRGMRDGVDDPQARIIEARVNGTLVICTYVPNGQTVGSDKYAYKLKWMERLLHHLEQVASPTDDLIVCGDWNVALDDKDVARPDEWRGSVLCDSDTRVAVERLRAWGLTDVFRMHHADGGLYSWWDYRMLAFPKGNGLRIDLIFATASLAKRCTGARIDRDERKGKKPSDHAPVIAVFD